MIKVPLKAPTQLQLRAETFVAPWPCELVSSIPAVQYNTGTQRHWRRVLHCFVPNVQPGNVLQCKACFEVTNNLGYTVELTAAMILTSQDTGTAGIENLSSVSGPEEPEHGRFITRCPGFNVTSAMHHAVFTLTKDFIVPDGMVGDQYVAVVAYCGGLEYWPTSQVVIVEQWCSDISVTRLRV